MATIQPRNLGCQRLLLLFWLVSCGQIASGAVLDRIGVMGDSLSSEYVGGLNTESFFGNSYLPYKSWVEQLVDSRNLNFGPYGFWGPETREGFLYNNASIFSVDTAKLLSAGQHTTLASQNPTLAILAVGGNDFFFHAREHNLPSIFFGGSFDGENPNVIIDDTLNRIETAINTVAGPSGSPNGTAMVLCTIPDITLTPIAQTIEDAGAFYPGTFELYRPAILAVNGGIRQLAAERGFALADFQLEFDSLLAPGGVPVDHLTIEGLTFPLGPSDPQTNADLFLVDGFHPATIIHGKIANLIAAAANATYDTRIPLLTDREILAHAGFAVPEPSIETLVACLGFTLAAIWVKRRKAYANSQLSV